MADERGKHKIFELCPVRPTRVFRPARLTQELLMLLYAPWPASFASNDNNNHNKRCLQTRLSAYFAFCAAMLTRAASSLRSSSRSRCNVAVAALRVNAAPLLRCESDLQRFR